MDVFTPNPFYFCTVVSQTVDLYKHFAGNLSSVVPKEPNKSGNEHLVITVLLIFFFLKKRLKYSKEELSL